ncbi:RNA methyltransferase [soil metagenome]
MRKRSTRKILKDNLNRTSPLRDHFILWLHNIRSLHNVGAAFRNADAFGVHKLLLSGFTPRPPRAEITKTAIGAEEHVIWEYTEDIVNEADILKKIGYQIVGLEQTDQSVMLPDYHCSDSKICLVLGNEVTGIDSELLSMLDSAVEIPQFGMKHSLNVSVASGVALYGFLQKLQ